MAICICSLRELKRQVKRLSAKHVVSLIGMEGMPRTPWGVSRENHLRLAVDDIEYDIPGYDSPRLSDVERLVTFGERWTGDTPVIVHCYAGISRSSAAALTLLSQKNPGREMEAAQLIRERAPHANPNLLIVELADRLLGSQGRLLDAAQNMGPSEYVVPAPPVVVPLSLDGSA